MKRRDETRSHGRDDEMKVKGFWFSGGVVMKKEKGKRHRNKSRKEKKKRKRCERVSLTLE